MFLVHSFVIISIIIIAILSLLLYLHETRNAWQFKFFSFPCSYN